MKVTLSQIKKALNNSFEVGVDGTMQLYARIREAESEAYRMADIKKSIHHYTAADRLKIARIIKASLAKKPPITK